MGFFEERFFLLCLDPASALIICEYLFSFSFIYQDLWLFFLTSSLNKSITICAKTEALAFNSVFRKHEVKLIHVCMCIVDLFIICIKQFTLCITGVTSSIPAGIKGHFQKSEFVSCNLMIKHIVICYFCFRSGL